MDQLSPLLARIRIAAEAVGMAALAKEADVPLTTVRSFAARQWTHRNLEIVEKLAAASSRIALRDGEKA